MRLWFKQFLCGLRGHYDWERIACTLIKWDLRLTVYACPSCGKLEFYYDRINP